MGSETPSEQLKHRGLFLMNLSSQSRDNMEAPQCPGPRFLLSYCPTSSASALLLIEHSSCLSSSHHIYIPVNEDTSQKSHTPVLLILHWPGLSHMATFA